ncbi:MAG: hypothetical protein PHW18_12910 [Sulfuricurvum sp.]|uniref:hypothetical protein n=1 Tax=Sulfuricurvum sp. TaxID=2025608 RepID=UPI0026222630|nr:hypothetical protein [Sulfuricurvum sp.]MDD2830467.1 hypothetical protein [Sulfuricurvum sp.]MDD4948374.1 hypothetical protein [Sulfuricurvum sp.]
MRASISFLISIFSIVLILSSCGSSDNSSTSDSVVSIDRIDINSSTPYIGINISQLSYWDGANAMVDMVFESEFRSSEWGYDVGADVDGAPTQDFNLIFSSRRVAIGTYKLVFKGEAELYVSGTPEIDGEASPYITNLVYDATHNLTTADVVIPSVITNNSYINFSNTRRTSTSAFHSGVTDIHLWRSSYPTDGSVIFTKEFLRAMKSFHLIRCMEFISTNENDSVNWSERTTMRHLGRPISGREQPWELMVLLANETGNDLWINVPTRANDDYITKLSQLLRYGSDGINPYTSVQQNPIYPPLKEGIRVYVEYGNELWNPGPGFSGFYWARDFADVARAQLNHPINYDGTVTDDQYLALRRWIAYRSSVISLTFRRTFGDKAMMNTVRPILSAQASNGNAYLSEELKWAEGFYGKIRNNAPYNDTLRTVNELWWGGGGAAYYDSNVSPSSSSQATMKGYFDGLPTDDFAKMVAIDATWTRGFGLANVAYEGGPEPGGSALGGTDGNSTLSALYNADTRMKERMIDAHRIFEGNGGQLFVYYVYSSSIPWSFVNDVTPSLVSDTNTTKLQATQFIRYAPKSAPTLGTLLPATISLHDMDKSIIMDSEAGWGYDGMAYRLSPRTDTTHGEFALIPVRSAETKVYRVSLVNYDPPQGAQIEILIDGISAGIWTLQGFVDGQAHVSSSLSVTISKGLHIVRIRSLQGTLWMKELSVAI